MKGVIYEKGNFIRTYCHMRISTGIRNIHNRQYGKIRFKDMQRIDKISEIVEKEANEKAKTVKKAKSENATCYIDGIKQDSAFDPDGLNIYDYDISYKNNRLYFKTIKKSEYTSSMNNGGGWYFPLYFPVFR